MTWMPLQNRKAQKSGELNRVNQQIKDCEDAIEINAQKTNNLERKLQMNKNYATAMQDYAAAQSLYNMNYEAGLTGCDNSGVTGTSATGNSNAASTGQYVANDCDGDWMKYFWPKTQSAMVDSDLELQKQQLETRAQVISKELEQIDKSIESAIGRSTAKYA